VTRNLSRREEHLKKLFVKDEVVEIGRVQSVIWFICGFIEVAILFRFTLLFLGASPQVGFTNFVYTVSTPLVAPFLAVMGLEPSYGNSVIEFSALVAAVAYLALATGFAQIATLFLSPKIATPLPAE
jgi:uncharacterized protein YggT (Ycf19 family)